jgi:glycosyltransferase involved in cell wall biosynthesis
VRVLFLITDLEIGGTPRVVRDLAIRLRSPEISTAVASLAPRGPICGELEAAGVPVTSLGASHTYELPRVVRDVVRMGKRFDVIFSFLLHANATAAIASRWLGSVRFLQSIQTTQPDPRWHWLLQGMVERAAEKIVVPSQSVANVAVERGRVPRDRIEVIPNAIEVERFESLHPAIFSRPWTRIGFIGRLDPVKRVSDLVRALALLERAELHVYGEGEDRRNIERAIHDADVEKRAILHGRILQPQDVLPMLDMLVLPSAAEGFGLVLIEAMAAGIPVIATDVPGIRDVVRHEETGLLVPVANPAALAAAIERMRSDVELRQRLLTRARADVRERYTWPKVLARYRALLLKS